MRGDYKLLACLSLLIIVGLARGQTACKTPDFKDGTCITASDCQFIRDTFKNSKMNQTELFKFLASYKCGEEKACCPKQEETNTRAATVQNNLLPEKGTCGRFEERKIVGGEKAGVEEFPWAALVEYRRPSGTRTFNCGGTLINDRYVLTAAHCVILPPKARDWKIVSVRLGETDLAKNPDCDPNTNQCNNNPMDFSVSDSIVHENYQNTHTGNDIALLRLRRKVGFTKFIKPACLPLTLEDQNWSFVGRYPTVTGWGRTENSSFSDAKLRVEIPVMTNDNCNTIFRSQVTINPKQVCAGGEEGKDSCPGDSGGGLTLKDDRNNWIVIGIVSYGPDYCGLRGVPGVYTRVSGYVDWISKKIQP